MPSYFENEIIFMKLIFCVTDGSLTSATQLRRLCFYRCLSVHGGVSQHALQVVSQHALQVVSQHALQQVSRGVSAPRGVPGPGGSALGGAWSGGSAPGGSAPRGGLVSQHAFRQRRLLLLMVCIPLECILVCKNLLSLIFGFLGHRLKI